MEGLDLHQLGQLKGISIAHINIRSLFGKLEDISRILTVGNICILGISETWLNGSVPNSMINIPQYDIYRHDRTRNSGKLTGGGVCIYAHTKYNIIAREDLSACTPDIEVIWVQLALKDTKPTYIGCVYRSPSGNLEAALEFLEDQVLEIKSKGTCDLVLLGDYNVNSLKSRSIEHRKLTDFCKRHCLNQLIKTPTYFQNAYNSSIDDILVSNKDYYYQYGTVATGTTDHLLIYTARKKLKVQPETCYIYGRTFSKFDPIMFQRDCIFTNWDEVLNSDDVNEAWDKFQHILQRLLDKHAPKRQMTVSEDLPPWITREFLETCRDRDYWLDKNTKSNDPVVAITCKEYKSRVRRLKTTLKRDYFRLALEEAKGDGNRVWRAIEKAYNTVSRKKTKFRINNVDDPLENAEILNKFFIEIGPTLDENLGPDPGVATENSLECPLLTLHLTNENEVSKIVQNLSVNTASGDDGFSARIIKAALPVFIPIITNLINQSIIQKIVPQKWKHACVTPIFKAGDKCEANNYRPISVLPTISKILERVIKLQLQSHLDLNDIITGNQYGFRKNHSTETCILKLLNDLYTAHDNGLLGGIVYIDLKKAFDTVSHNIMLRKLQSIGVSVDSIEWFRSYLLDRTQITRVSGKSSTALSVQMGVPQGSILGPVLFQIYVNDLPKYINDSKVSMFADDTAIYATAESIDELELILQDDLHSLSQWLLYNRLSINVKKSKVMITGSLPRLRATREPNVSINGIKLDVVNEYLYLGVVIDSGLRFNSHVNTIYDKCASKLGLICKTRKLFDYRTSRLLYVTTLLPVIDYCNSVYSVASQSELERLQKLQNIAIRVITRQGIRCPVYELHHRAQLDTLATRREKWLLKLCFKWVHGDGPPSICNLMKPDTTALRTTRQTMANTPLVPRCKTVMGTKSIKYRATKSWAEAKQEFKSCVKIDQLKRKLRTVWDTFD